MNKKITGYRVNVWKVQLICFLILSSIFSINAQHQNWYKEVGIAGSYISNDRMPFWLRSNQSGGIPLDKASVSIKGILCKEYDINKKGLADWGVSFEGWVNAGHKKEFILVEGYGKIRLGIFELRAGRTKEIMGLCDTSLSSGAFAVSGNAPGIPKIQVSIPEFYTLPIFGNLFAFKGNFAHGWLGALPMELNDSIFPVKTFFHQKSLYGRFGKPEWNWKLHGGFNHQVFWGNEDFYYGDMFTLSPWKTYLYVVTGTPYGTTGIPRSKIGNHLGSIDMGVEYDFRNLRLKAYRQNIYEVGALYYLANLRDGLNGISLENIAFDNKGFQWKKVLVELFYTKNQAGELWSPPTKSGDENYYNNYQYVEGWSYKDFGIGNPFICTRTYTREGLPADPNEYYINNRVVVMHLGFEGSVNKWDFVIKSSYSLNYGTFGTSEVGHTTGKIRTLPLYGIFSEIRQFSGYLEAERSLNNGMHFGFVSAIDTGKLYYDSFGLQFRVSKSF